jgi:hypothetical protein
VRHAFQGLPGAAGRPRPIVDLVVEGLGLAPQACLLDSGASEIRMGGHVAEIAGIDLTGSTASEIVIGGLRTAGRGVRVQLELRQGAARHAWSPMVYFCDPWPWAFGLLGLAGLDPFRVVLDTYEEWVELQPVPR